MVITSENNVKSEISYVGKMFKRRDREVYITVLEEDLDKTKTVLVEFLDGKTMKLSVATISDTHLWVPYDGLLPEPEEPEPERYIPGTPDEEATIMTRVATEKEKEKKRKPKKIKADRDNSLKLKPKKNILCPVDFYEQLLKLGAEMGFDVVRNKRDPALYALYGTEHRLMMDIHTGLYSILVCCKAGIDEKLPDVPFKMRKGNTIYPFSYSQPHYDMTNIKKLIAASQELLIEKYQQKQRLAAEKAEFKHQQQMAKNQEKLDAIQAIENQLFDNVVKKEED